MGLLDDITKETRAIASGVWTKRDGQVVPEPDDITLTNDGVNLTAAFLFADLADSTELASHNQEIAAEVYKAYLMGSTRIIRSLDGEIRSFDGDRVMGVFLGNRKHTNAVKAALHINYFFTYVLRPAFASIYTTTFPSQFNLTQTAGVESGEVLVARSGIKNDNDLIWVGKAPNIAAKLSSIRAGYSTLITEGVFDIMLDEAKFSDANEPMWEKCTWGDGNKYGIPIVYRSNWWWRVP